jgi:hypothetical protein
MQATPGVDGRPKGGLAPFRERQPIIIRGSLNWNGTTGTAEELG